LEHIVWPAQETVQQLLEHEVLRLLHCNREQSSDIID